MSREITFAGVLAGTTVTIAVSGPAAGKRAIAYLQSGQTFLATAQCEGGEIRAADMATALYAPRLWIGRAQFELAPSEAERLAAFIAEVSA